MTRDRHGLFVQATPGLEDVVAQETAELLDREAEPVPGGVEAHGSLEDAAGLVLWSRTGARVLVVVGEIPSASLQQAYAEARKLPWKQWLHPGQQVEVKATVRKARIRHPEALAAKISQAVRDATKGPRRAGRPPPPLPIRVRLEGKRATLSIDAAGLLHQRGYRQATAKAPIRENLAASMLFAAGWQPGVPLADPMCGSGTFSIEAALWAEDRAPGVALDPVVTRLPGFPKGRWPAMKKQSGEHPVPTAILTADRDQGAIKATLANAARAGVDLSPVNKSIEQPFPTVPSEPGLVVLNPPYGRRVAENTRLAPLFHRIGRALSEQFGGWRLVVVCPDKSLVGRLARAPDCLAQFSNGGIEVGLYVSEIESPRGA